jgi:hypothetical protein
MDAIRDLIKTAMDKDATGFEANFAQAIAPKLDDALSAKYDAMFGGKPAVEETDEVEAETETEEELDTGTSK